MKTLRRDSRRAAHTAHTQPKVPRAKHSLDSIYKKLYSSFGPQYWWPAETPFEVIVGAILTQNTNWLNVEKAIHNLKTHQVLTPQALFVLPPEKLSALIRPAGYYNIKAKRLKEFLKFLCNGYQGDINTMRKEDTSLLRRKLLSVHGIGPETADSILLYALHKPVFVIDAYTKRILQRHALLKQNATYEEAQQLCMQNVKTGAGPVTHSVSLRRKDKGSKLVKVFNEYHALLVKTAKEFCLKNKPRCEVCPLR
jgi:endonuclease-3 related protein